LELLEQTLLIDGNLLLITQIVLFSDRHLLALFELDLFVFELLRSDCRAGCIGHNGHGLIELSGDSAYAIVNFSMRVLIAVRKIESNDIEPSFNKLSERLLAI